MICKNNKKKGKLKNGIIQEYLEYPLLLDKYYKFDIRVFLLI